jgi:hypothetical protein
VSSADRRAPPSTASKRPFDGTVVVVAVVFTSKDSCWAALTVVDVNGEVHRAVGDSLRRFAEIGHRRAIRGMSETHVKHGEQIRVARAVPCLETEVAVDSPFELLCLAPRVGEAGSTSHRSLR